MDRLDTTLGVAEEQAVSWVRDACNGLARVHRHGLLHRDVKPENLFLTESAKCLVGDLSLAGVQNASGCVAAGGTLETMAPEVGAVDIPGYAGDVEVYCVRSEVFSLGATLYWMLAGTPPVTGTRYRDAAAASPVDLWELAPHISRGTRDIVMKTLGRDPAIRYPTPPHWPPRWVGATVPLGAGPESRPTQSMSCATRASRPAGPWTSVLSSSRGPAGTSFRCATVLRVDALRRTAPAPPRPV